MVSEDRVYDEPSEVAAESGDVVVDGPGSVAVMLTPEAAAETSHRLLFAAAEAQGQRLAARKKGKPGGAAPPARRQSEPDEGR